ncbi:hypothetical protein FGO68_gene7747 [Halteria grandinella]|uniref:Uncharacterized protein n=1 Tax=Halteria grandinella TaxID=5974 RepID=A0A8J8P204_HALGN|nr:hypothetical protein FGO68_gene7747 [Halteria grandinella]
MIGQNSQNASRGLTSQQVQEYQEWNIYMRKVSGKTQHLKYCSQQIERSQLSSTFSQQTNAKKSKIFHYYSKSTNQLRNALHQRGQIFPTLATLLQWSILSIQLRISLPKT